MPCRIIGDEVNIRRFFYIYFYEKYYVLDSAYEPVLIDISERFINQLINYYDFNQVDYSDFNIIRLLLKINMYRYKHNHLLPNQTETLSNNVSLDDFNHFQQIAQEILIELDPQKIYIPYEITIPFLKNLLFPFHQIQIRNSYDSLITEGASNDALAEEINFLKRQLNELSKKYKFPLNNTEKIIYYLHNSVAMKKYDPRSNHILYNSNAFFAKNIAKRFPLFFEDIQSFIENYLDLKDIEHDHNYIIFLIYTLFIHWEQLYLHLENRFKEIKVLILSDSNVSHAKMIRDMLEASFYSYLSVDYFNDPVLTEDNLKKLKYYDLVIANFPVDTKYATHLIQTENFPTILDMEKIENKMAEVLLHRSAVR